MNGQPPMPKSRKDDLNDILGEIRTGSVRKPAAKGARAKGRPSSEQRGYLLMALLFLAGTIAYIAYDNLKTPAAPTEEAEIAPGIPADVNVVSAVGPGNFGGGSAGGSAPASILDQLPVPYSEFGLVAMLKEATGPDYDVWVLLRAPLDAYTENIWHRAGMLRNEGPIESPYIRKVTVGSRASLDTLIDWHVDVVARVPVEAQK